MTLEYHNKKKACLALSDLKRYIKKNTFVSIADAEKIMKKKFDLCQINNLVNKLETNDIFNNFGWNKTQLFELNEEYCVVYVYPYYIISFPNILPINEKEMD